MANKRILKKQIKYICGEVALQCIITRECFNGNSDKLNEIFDTKPKAVCNKAFSPALSTNQSNGILLCGIFKRWKN